MHSSGIRFDPIERQASKQESGTHTRRGSTSMLVDDALLLFTSYLQPHTNIPFDRQTNQSKTKCVRPSSRPRCCWPCCRVPRPSSRLRLPPPAPRGAYVCLCTVWVMEASKPPSCFKSSPDVWPSHIRAFTSGPSLRRRGCRPPPPPGQVNDVDDALRGWDVSVWGWMQRIDDGRRQFKSTQPAHLDLVPPLNNPAAKPIEIDPRLQPVVYDGPTVPSGAVDVRAAAAAVCVCYDMYTYIYIHARCSCWIQPFDMTSTRPFVSPPHMHTHTLTRTAGDRGGAGGVLAGAGGGALPGGAGGARALHPRHRAGRGGAFGVFCLRH